ncbi:DoxX family membrane protein [Pontibacter fetidus]|uniref:DoxX family membrane protein n=1 Tax=Pontibacter fetidus TaxID=2700082 RepID=A0A6B2HB33_9BACT|nr:DoxX family membrane protein [Pontibacter fetidus]NDK56754.1 DoxX family membrane protein [Pontibacter fetidus]
MYSYFVLSRLTIVYLSLTTGLMEKYLPYAVLFLRIALAFTILAFVADKLGYLGQPGTSGILWADWDMYIKKLQAALPYIPKGISEKLAIAATLLETILALMLLFGVKVRWAAIGTGIYTLLLAIVVGYAISVIAVLNYGLLAVSAAAFLLACCPIYKFTRHGIKKRSTYHPY